MSIKKSEINTARPLVKPFLRICAYLASGQKLLDFWQNYGIIRTEMGTDLTCLKAERSGKNEPNLLMTINKVLTNCYEDQRLSEKKQSQFVAQKP